MTDKQRVKHAERQARKHARETILHFERCHDSMSRADRTRSIFNAYMIGYHHGAVDVIDGDYVASLVSSRVQFGSRK